MYLRYEEVYVAVMYSCVFRHSKENFVGTAKVKLIRSCCGEQLELAAQTATDRVCYC